MSDKVRSLYGGPTGIPDVNESVIEVLADLTERAKAGTIHGLCVGYVEHDGCGAYRAAGQIGSYSLLGALTLVQHNLAQWMADQN